jgi:hypothetical protein
MKSGHNDSTLIWEALAGAPIKAGVGSTAAAPEGNSKRGRAKMDESQPYTPGAQPIPNSGILGNPAHPQAANNPDLQQGGKSLGEGANLPSRELESTGGLRIFVTHVGAEMDKRYLNQRGNRKLYFGSWGGAVAFGDRSAGTVYFKSLQKAEEINNRLPDMQLRAVVHVDQDRDPGDDRQWEFNLGDNVSLPSTYDESHPVAPQTRKSLVAEIPTSATVGDEDLPDVTQPQTPIEPAALDRLHRYGKKKGDEPGDLEARINAVAKAIIFEVNNICTGRHDGSPGNVAADFKEIGVEVGGLPENRGKHFVRAVVKDILMVQGWLVTDTQRIRKKKAGAFKCGKPVKPETLISKLGNIFK